MIMVPLTMIIWQGKFYDVFFALLTYFYVGWKTSRNRAYGTSHRFFEVEMGTEDEITP